MGDHRLYVRFPDGEIRHGGYRSSCDLAFPALFETPEAAAQAGYLHGRTMPEHTDGDPVEVAVDYGYGMQWRAIATSDWLLTNHDPCEAGYDGADGLPTWLTEYFAEDDQ